MTTALTSVPASSKNTDQDSTMTTSAATTTTSSNSVTFGRLVSAEWLKLRTVRSTVGALFGAMAAAIGLGALFTSLSDSEESAGPARALDDSLSLSLAGFDLAVLIIAIMGVALVAGEYQTGLIRSWFAATSRRIGTLMSKISVYSAVVFALTFVAAVVAFVIGQALFPDASAALSLGDDGVWQAISGTAFYAGCIAAMGIAFGFLLRSTAAGSAAVVSLLMMAPLLASLLPDSIGEPIAKVLPSNAGDAISGISSSSELLSVGGGFIALLAWVGGSVIAAAVVLRRRDA